MLTYYVWIVRMVLRGNSIMVAYRFVHTMKVANTGFGFIDRRHPIIKKCKKAGLYTQLLINGMNPMLAMRLTKECMACKKVYYERRIAA